MAGNSKELTGRGLGRWNMAVWKQQEEREGRPIQSPKSLVPNVGCKTWKDCKRNSLLESQPDFCQGKKEKQMLGEDTGEFTDDRRWVPEDTMERFGDGGRGDQSFKHFKE